MSCSCSWPSGKARDVSATEWVRDAVTPMPGVRRQVRCSGDDGDLAVGLASFALAVDDCKIRQRVGLGDVDGERAGWPPRSATPRSSPSPTPSSGSTEPHPADTADTTKREPGTKNRTRHNHTYRQRPSSRTPQPPARQRVHLREHHRLRFITACSPALGGYPTTATDCPSPRRSSQMAAGVAALLEGQLVSGSLGEQLRFDDALPRVHRAWATYPLYRALGESLAASSASPSLNSHHARGSQSLPTNASTAAPRPRMTTVVPGG
jgi:hypothetical protein